MYVPDDIRSLLYATRRVCRMRVYRGYIRAFVALSSLSSFRERPSMRTATVAILEKARGTATVNRCADYLSRAAARLRPSAARFRRGRNFSDRTCDELSLCLSVPLAEGGCIPRFPWRCRVACDKRVTTAWTTSEIEISRTAASRLRARIIINAATYRHGRERKREKEGEGGNNWIVECGAVSAPRRACFSSELR